MLEFDRLIEAAFAKLGSTSNLELAKAIGLSGDYRSQRVARWRSKNAADYEGTIKLLEYVGWLRHPDDREAAAEEGDASVGAGGVDPWDRVRYLRGELERVLAETDELIAEGQRRAAQRPGSGAPRRRARGQAGPA